MPKQDVSVQLYYDGSWNDLVDDDQVLADTPITITRGYTDEGQTPRPTSVALRLKNHDDRFRTSNPLSPLYGKAGVNTPLQVSVASVVRADVEASSWSCDQTTDFRPSPLRGNAWVDVQAGGLLQRIGQWTHTARTPLRVATESLASLTGYWPLEDPAGSVVATSVIDGTRNVNLIGHSFGSQNRPPGGGPAVDIGDHPIGGYLCLPGDLASTGGWQFNYVVFLNKFTGGGASDPVMFLQLLNGLLVDVLIDGDTRDMTINVTDTTATIIGTNTVSTSGYPWQGRWIMMQLIATYSGGTTTIGASWRGVDDDGWIGFSATYAGVTSQIYGVSAGTSLPEGSSYGHVVTTAGTTDPLDSADRYIAFQGHAGERTSYRFARLNAENNIDYYVSSGFADSTPMGPQTGAETLAKWFEEIQWTEDALIFDHRSERRLFLTSRADRFNQTPALTIDASDGGNGLVALPAEVSDDLPVNNVVTVKQRTGGDYTASDDTGPMGTQDPPDGRGEYRQDVNVNVSEPATDLPQQGHWWLNRGTVNRPRFPSITLNLTILGSTQLAAAEAVDIGSVIEIVNFREYTVRLYVLGYKELIGTHTRTITFTCAPDDVFNAGILDTNRLQARSTTLNADITSSATSLTLKMTDVNERWRTGANSVPILLGGEQITLGTVGAVSGSGPWTQAVTGCTRAVNGIHKAHTAGDPVTVVSAIRLTL